MMRWRKLFSVSCTLLVASLVLPNASGQVPSPRLPTTESPRTPSAAQPESVRSDRRSEPTNAETVPQLRFTVQVGAYQNRANADALAQKLRSRYQLESFITPLYISTKTLHRVRVPVGTKPEAEALAARLEREEKLRTWVVPLTRADLDSVWKSHRSHTKALSTATVPPISEDSEPHRRMLAEKAQEQGESAQEVPTSRTEPPGSSHAAENTATSELAEQQRAPVQEVGISQSEPSSSSQVTGRTAAPQGDPNVIESTQPVFSTSAEVDATLAEDCYAYRLDEERNRITFNDPSIYVTMPPRSERRHLRSRGTPAQVFRMKNCDTLDPAKKLEMYREASDAARPSERVPSTIRVVILAEAEDWIQVRGHSSLWRGKGWIRLEDDILVVKY